MDRQDERDISMEDIEYVIGEPSNEIPAKRPGRRKFWKRVGKHRIMVILKEIRNGKEAIIITAYKCD